MVKKNAGWTLVEVLMVLAILGVIGMTIPRILPVINQVFILGRAKIDLQEQARAAMYILTRELRQAQSGTITIDRISGQPYYSRITFTNMAGKTIVVSQSGTTLNLSEGVTNTTLSKDLAYL